VAARFLLRLDDLCPTADWQRWGRLEAILDAAGVKPIVAVVPENQDPSLRLDEPRRDFWEWLQRKSLQGWCVALHGYQHKKNTQSPGLVGLRSSSEFAGLPYATQAAKINTALTIFNEHGISPRMFVAPWHSFDQNTLQAVLMGGINLIADGFYLRPVQRFGIVWVPQQISHFRWFPFGLWTVCLHPNNMSVEDIDALSQKLDDFRPHIIDLDTALRRFPPKPLNLTDKVFASLWTQRLRKEARANDTR
jgi:predicted deacetylase